MRKLFAFVLVVAALPFAAQAQNYDTVQVRSTLLSRNVYMLTGSGGNIGLAVGDDAVFMIDDQFAPLTPKILAAIAAITPKPATSCDWSSGRVLSSQSSASRPGR